MANNYKIKMKDIQNKYKFKIFCAGYEYDDTELRNEISQRALISEAGRYVELELNPNTYVLTAKLKDKNNNVISTSTPIDLPLESMIVDCDYDATTKSLIITLQNGNTTTIPLGDLISGLATEEDLEEVDAKVDANIEKISDLENELNQYKTIYNVLPKVSGNGESITLNDTGESILKLDLKGQCKQDSTTGKNILPNDISSTTLLGVTITKNDDGSLTLNGTASNQGNLTIGEVSFENGETYTISGVTGFADTTLQIYTASTNAFPSGNRLQCYNGAVTRTAQADENCLVKLYIYGGVTYNNVTIYPMIVEESTSGDYEPYTGGATPRPDFPQQIHEVSGDNEINVCGKNLFTTSGLQSSGWNVSIDNPLKGMSAGDYTISCQNKYITSGKGIAICFNNTPNTDTGRIGSYFVGYDFGNTIMNQTKTLTQEQLNATYMVILGSDSSNSQQVIENMQIQLEKSSTATTYEPHNEDTYELDLGDIKMRGIGTYEDYFVRNSGKNLLNKETCEKNKLLIWTTGATTNETNSIASDYYIVKPTEQYSFTYWSQVMFYDKNKEYLGCLQNDKTTIAKTSGTTVKLLTIPNYDDIYYMRLGFRSNVENNNVNMITADIMVNKGNTLLPYEPYGTGQWCKYNAIGNVVLDGSETYNTNQSTDDKIRFTTNCFENNKPKVNNIGLSNYLIVQVENFKNGLSMYSGDKNAYIWVLKTLASSTSDFATWVSTHNIEIDYPLSSPYLSLIESETLISQLDKVEKALGKDGQTNISQVNNDAPFKIYASALEKISNS